MNDCERVVRVLKLRMSKHGRHTRQRINNRTLIIIILLIHILIVILILLLILIKE